MAEEFKYPWKDGVYASDKDTSVLRTVVIHICHTYFIS